MNEFRLTLINQNILSYLLIPIVLIGPLHKNL